MPERTYVLSELQRLRTWRNLSQQGLSDASGVPLSTIQKQERRAMKDTTLSTAAALAEALGVPVEALYTPSVTTRLLEHVEAVPA